MLSANRIKSATFLLLTMLMAVGCDALTTDEVAVRVVSTRPDTVSGGDALIEITGPLEAIRSHDLIVLANVNRRFVQPLLGHPSVDERSCPGVHWCGSTQHFRSASSAPIRVHPSA